MAADSWLSEWGGGNVRPGPVLADPPERLTRRQPRQITQITGDNHGLFALCSDGTVWEFGPQAGVDWLPLPVIPQRQIGEADS